MHDDEETHDADEQERDLLKIIHGLVLSFTDK